MDKEMQVCFRKLKRAAVDLENTFISYDEGPTERDFKDIDKIEDQIDSLWRRI